MTDRWQFTSWHSLLPVCWYRWDLTQLSIRTMTSHWPGVISLWSLYDCQTQARTKNWTWIRKWTWSWTQISTHVVLVAQVDAANLDLQVFDHLGGQFLHKRVLLFLRRFLWKSRKLWSGRSRDLKPGPGPEQNLEPWLSSDQIWTWTSRDKHKTWSLT